MIHLFSLFLAFITLLAAAEHCWSGTYRVELVRDGAVIARKGPDTSFPSIIKVPSWLAPEDRASPEAEYYLYFGSDHREYLHMKWAQTPMGPWHEFNLGGIVNGHHRRGVFDLLVADPPRSRRRVAGADVQVDSQAKQIVLLYYGNKRFPDDPTSVSWGGYSLVATSKDGLNFHDPETDGGQPGHGPRTVKVDGAVRDAWIGPAYQRAFQHRGSWYSVSQRGILAKASDPQSPWSANTTNSAAMAWEVEDKPKKLWREDAANIQSGYVSPAATFLASTQFAEHPHNPNPGIRFDSEEERIDQVSVCLLPNDQLEIFFCIRDDPGDRYDGIYRVVLDISPKDFRDWDLVRDASGQVLFETVLHPASIRQLTQTQVTNFDPIYHADPVSLGDPFVFVDEQHRKFLFYSYKSQRYKGYEGRGQISSVQLFPNAEGM